MAKRKKSTTRSDAELQDVTRNWRTLIPGITTLNEEEAKRCISLEAGGERRKDFLMRLYGRFNKLRYERELQDLLKGCD